MAKAWHFLPENSESWGYFLQHTTQGLRKLFQTRAKSIKRGDQVHFEDEDWKSQAGVVLSVGLSADGKEQANIACGDVNKRKPVHDVKLSMCPFNWLHKTIIADGNPGFEKARDTFAIASHPFSCTMHRSKNAYSNLCRVTAKKFISIMQDYSNGDDKKFAAIRQMIDNWKPKHSKWVKRVEYNQQMPWCSPMNLINGAFKTI